MAELCEDTFGWGPLVSPQPPYLLTPCFGEMVVYLIPQFAAFVYFSSSALFCRTKEHKQEVLLSTWDSRLLTSRMVFSFLAALAFAGFWLIRFFTDVPIQNYYYFQIVIGTLAHIAAIAHQRIVFFRKYSGDGALLLFWLSNILVDALRLRMLIVVFSDKLDYWTISILALHAFFAIVAFILEMTNKEYSNWAAWLGDEDGHLCPESYSNFFSIVTFWWMNGLIRKGYKQSLVDGDLWRLPAFLRPRLVFNRFAPYWFDELKKPLERQSILWALFRCHGFYLAYGGSLKLVQDLLGFAQPFLLQELIAFVTEATEKPEGEVNLETGLLIAVAMFVTAITQTIFLHQYFHASISCGVQVRSEITSMLYRKSLVLNNKARQASSVGEVVTQMSIDAQRIQDMLQYVHHLWSAPLTIGLSLAFLYLVLGPSIFAGLGAMVLMIPINGVVAWRMSILQTQQMTNKDMRIKLMDEVLGGIRVIKLYSWEKAFMRRVIGIRDQEITTLRGIAIYDAIQNFTWTAAPFLVSLASFTTYTLTGQILTSEKAFVALSLFNILQFPLMIFPMLISGIVDVRVSLSRLKKFFQAEELDKEAIGHASTATEITEEEDDLTFAAGRRDGYAPISTNDDRDENDGTSMHTSHQIGIIARNATFAWNDVTVPFLRDINFELRPGQLVAVVGPVGAGKSSLLAAILGEMIKCNGSLKVNGSIGYAPQQPWICNTTLAENIRFGQALDEQRYRAAIASCALLPDIAMLPSGDQTEIGEKGINLSGGQKQRVSLARAVYADADIYLLDDPLSAVDAHVGRHLFDQVIGPSGILRSKSRLLVTHSVTYLPQCDYFLVVRDGAIIERGTFTELMAESTSFKRLLTEFSAITKTDQASETHEEQTSVEYSLNKDENSEADQVKHDPKTLIDKEDVQVGAVKAAVYYDYFKTIGTGSVAFLLLLFVIGEAALVGSSLWLSYWSAQESNDQIGLYIGVYAAFGTLGAVFIVAQVLFGFVVCGLRAAARLHAALLSNVMRAPMSFFDTTPTGRIVNRFSKDQYTIDEVLPQAFLSYLRQVFIVIGILVVISLSTPVFIIAVVPLGLLYWFIQVYYINTSRQLKRLDSVSKSPIFAHFQETLQGVVTIRAFGHQSRFIRENESRVDMNQRPFYASVSSNRWLATRLEFIGATIVFLSALFSVLGYKTISPSLVGLSVSYALQVTSELNWMVRMASDVETNVVAVERVREYTRIETEAPDSIPANLPSSKWPQEGAITFDHYGTRYRAGLDLVLQDVSFSVLPHEKIGVCGRTGAGKSSLTQALFRLLEPAEGHIDIDQCNTTLLGLHDLRSRLTIIPQDPVLFSGSLRYNLDPFTERTDDEIWQALEHASLKQTVEKLPNKLDSEVLSSGENFSVGQRQLLCLARALLRKSSILVLDEATAAVDLETDSIVQATIRREFAECTIFTIAHRLNTIMDSNRVLVLDKGQVKEFDSPSVLLANPNSEFYGLAKQAGLL